MYQQRENNSEYFVFMGTIAFFALVGLYFVFNFLWGDFHFGISGGVDEFVIERPIKTKTIDINNNIDIFTKEKFKELSVTEEYSFDADRLTFGKRDLFEARPEDAGEKTNSIFKAE